MGPLQRDPATPPAAFSQDPPRLRRRERTSLVKNRMREIRTSGSVRGGDGNVPTYSAILHQISGLYTCPPTLMHFCGYVGPAPSANNRIHATPPRMGALCMGIR